jgi:hypothetical protein
MDDFRILLPAKKQIVLMAIQALYEDGFHEGDAIKILRNAYDIDLSQETMRGFYNRFIRADVGHNAVKDLLSEFSAG